MIAELKRRYPHTIVGIKDSQCERAHSLALVQAFMPALTVHVGHEPDLPELGRRGSTGAVSGLANFMPRLVHRLVSQPDAPGTAQDLAKVNRLLACLGGYALIPALKGIMALRTGDMSWLRVRPPLVGLTPALHAALEALTLEERGQEGLRETLAKRLDSHEVGISGSLMRLRQRRLLPAGVE